MHTCTITQTHSFGTVRTLNNDDAAKQRGTIIAWNHCFVFVRSTCIVIFAATMLRYSWYVLFDFLNSNKLTDCTATICWSHLSDELHLCARICSLLSDETEKKWNEKNKKVKKRKEKKQLENRSMNSAGGSYYYWLWSKRI